LGRVLGVNHDKAVSEETLSIVYSADVRSVRRRPVVVFVTVVVAAQTPHETGVRRSRHHDRQSDDAVELDHQTEVGLIAYEQPAVGDAERRSGKWDLY